MGEAIGRQDDSPLAQEWLDFVSGRFASDEERAGTIGAKRSVVGEWRKKIEAGESFGVAPRFRLAMKDYLTSHRLELAYDDTARIVIREIRDKLNELELRLPPALTPAGKIETAADPVAVAKGHAQDAGPALKEARKPKPSKRRAPGKAAEGGSNA